MPSTDILKFLDYDANGNLTLKLGQNLECGSNGLRYTGVAFTKVFQGLPCVTEACKQQTDGSYNSAIRTNLLGEAHAPPVGCANEVRVVTNGNAGGIDLAQGSTATIPVLNGLSITNPASGCYQAKVTVYTELYVSVVSPNTHHHVLVDLVGNGTPGLFPEELNYTSAGPTNRLLIPLSSRAFDAGRLDPGDTTQFTVDMNVTNGSESDSTMGVFEWGATHRVILTAFEDC